MSDFPATFDIAGVTYNARIAEDNDSAQYIAVARGDETEERYSPSYTLAELKTALSSEAYSQQIGHTAGHTDGVKAING